jgi:HK97 gp10 family phage protein
MASTRLDQRALEQLLRGPEVAKDLERRAIRVEGGAIRRCPVDTGRLRSSITHGLFVDERGLVARIGSDVVYAPYVELGTRYMRAQPYLRPALMEANRA